MYEKLICYSVNTNIAAGFSQRLATQHSAKQALILASKSTW
jgi:hypothetical protein